MAKKKKMMKIVIHKDKKGSYFLFKGRKYRVKPNTKASTIRNKIKALSKTKVENSSNLHKEKNVPIGKGGIPERLYVNETEAAIRAQIALDKAEQEKREVELEVRRQKSEVEKQKRKKEEARARARGAIHVAEQAVGALQRQEPNVEPREEPEPPRRLRREEFEIRRADREVRDAEEDLARAARFVRRNRAERDLDDRIEREEREREADVRAERIADAQRELDENALRRVEQPVYNRRPFHDVREAVGRFFGRRNPPQEEIPGYEDAREALERGDLDFLYGEGKISIDKSGMTSDSQLNKIMSRYPDYLGTIAHNEIPLLLPKIKERSRGAFIINTDPASKNGEHWQAVYFDARPHGDSEIDFFDSYGDEPDSKLLHGLKLISEKLNANTFLKYKYNRIKLQSDRTSNCGWFCVQFLIDRFRGKPFKDATGFTDTVGGERAVEEFKEQNGFGYLSSFGQEGGLIGEVLSAIPYLVKALQRKDFPPAVRRIVQSVGSVPIKAIQVCRKPVQKWINTVLNLLSLGGWDKVKAKLGYSDLFHLYMLVTLQNGQSFRLERNHVIEMAKGGVESGSECMPVSAQYGHPNFTLSTIFDDLVKKKGDSLFRYDPADNNCQAFVTDFLRSAGALTPALSTFINQDAKTLFEKQPAYVKKFAKGVTDLASAGDTVIHGRGRK